MADNEREMKNNWWRRLIQGRWLSLSFYRRNITVVVVFVSLCVLYITFKFTVQEKQREILSLREHLYNVRTEMVRTSADYSSRILESEMTEALDTLGMPLRVAEQPPYFLGRKEAGGEK